VRQERGHGSTAGRRVADAPEDWQEIDAAFSSNADPLVGVDAQREMRELFRRVTHLAPAPIGVGPAHGGTERY
jgi:hypothetical protein